MYLFIYSCYYCGAKNIWHIWYSRRARRTTITMNFISATHPSNHPKATFCAVLFCSSGPLSLPFPSSSCCALGWLNGGRRRPRPQCLYSIHTIREGDPENKSVKFCGRYTNLTWLESLPCLLERPTTWPPQAFRMPQRRDGEFKRALNLSIHTPSMLIIIKHICIYNIERASSSSTSWCPPI